MKRSKNLFDNVSMIQTVYIFAEIIQTIHGEK